MDTCKNGCDLQGPPILETHLRAGYYGEWDGVTPRYYSRLIGVETEGYDGVSEWLCPDCGVRWDRWTGEVLEEARAATAAMGEAAPVDEHREKRLRDALVEYGSHKHDCQRARAEMMQGTGKEWPCTCGFTALSEQETPR